MHRWPLALLLLASVASGQTPVPPNPVSPIASIEAPATIPAGVELTAHGDKAVSSKRLSWKVITPKDAVYAVYDGAVPGAMLNIRNPTPGTTYKLAQVATGSDGSYDFDFAEITVGLSGVAPSPQPTPSPSPAPPAPAPTPAPTTVYAKPVHVTLVIDSKAMLASPAANQYLAAIVGSPAIAPALNAAGCYWHVLDVNDTAEYARRNLAKTVTAYGGPPCLVLMEAPATNGGVSRLIGSPLPVPNTDALLIQSVQATLAGGAR